VEEQRGRRAFLPATVSCGPLPPPFLNGTTPQSHGALVYYFSLQRKIILAFLVGNTPTMAGASQQRSAAWAHPQGYDILQVLLQSSAPGPSTHAGDIGHNAAATADPEPTKPPSVCLVDDQDSFATSYQERCSQLAEIELHWPQ